MVASGPVTASGRCGLSELDAQEVGAHVLAAWAAFLAVVEAPGTDLTRPSRLPGWSGRDVLVHLGSWPDALVMDAILTSAAEGGAGTTPSPDATNEEMLAAHRDASVDDVRTALHDARDRIEHFFTGGEADTWGRSLSRSTVGPLPVLSLVHAGCFELAVHALDLGPCGAPPPDQALLDRGLAALLDVTGALAARHDVDLTLTAQTPGGGWGFTSSRAGWTTQSHPPGKVQGAGVRGTYTDLLETACGRTNLPQLMLTRRLVVQQLPQWMRLAPLLDEVPGLPGGSTLKTAVGGLSGLTSGLGKVVGRFRP